LHDYLINNNLLFIITMKKTLNKIKISIVTLRTTIVLFLLKVMADWSDPIAAPDYWISEPKLTWHALLDEITKIAQILLIAIIFIVWIVSFLKIRKIEDKDQKKKKTKIVIVIIIILILMLIMVSYYYYNY